MAANPHLGEANGLQKELPVWKRVCNVCFWPFVFAVVITACVLLDVFLHHQFPQKPPIYSVAIASVAGLDPARDLTAAGRTTLSPVWNVTVHINNLRNAYDTECVPSLSTATVSYGDAFLGKGSVPEFCAGKRRESERVARVWGQDVVVPRFLRDQLAGELAVGEAAVDVKVTMPNGCSAMLCTDDLLICKAKIGGGFSPCGRTEAPSTKNQA